MEYHGQERPEPELTQFIPEFIQDRRTEVHKIREQLQNDQYQLISSLTHKWKGFAGPYGFGKLVLFAAQLTQESNSKNKIKVASTLDAIEEYLVLKEVQFKEGEFNEEV